LINYLNKLKGIDCLIYKNFAPKKGNRCYFTDFNAKKIDSIRISIEKFKNEKKINLDEYYYLITCLLLASDKVANITSVYCAYLKDFKNSSNKPLVLKPIHTLQSSNNNKVYNSDVNKIASKDVYDIVYLDPPYNNRQYSTNYHILNYISSYEDKLLHGITGVPDIANSSEYC